MSVRNPSNFVNDLTEALSGPSIFHPAKMLLRHACHYRSIRAEALEQSIIQFWVDATFVREWRANYARDLLRMLLAHMYVISKQYGTMDSFGENSYYGFKCLLNLSEFGGIESKPVRLVVSNTGACAFFEFSKSDA